MSFDSLKKSRKAELDKLLKQAEAETGKGQSDEYWKPEKDKAGNGQAIVRFLPAAEGEDIAWVKYYDHWFQGPTGQYYVEKSLTTIGQEDPVGQYNTQLWNSGVDEDKDEARKQKRRTHYVANVYIIKDYSNPENNGKVKKYRFGKKIYDKIIEAMKPVFEDDAPINPFDFWEGANFHIKIVKSDGWPNYDKSTFLESSALCDGDEAKLEEIYNAIEPLSPIIAEENFKSYDELKAKLNRVLCIEADSPVLPATPIKTMEAKPENTSVSTHTDESVSDDGTLSYFQNMIDED